MVDSGRLIRPADQFRKTFPQLSFREVFTFQTHGEPVLVTDPTYLADVYNSLGEPARTLRERGVFLMDFGGDTSCPVWWIAPFVLMPIALHLDYATQRPPWGTAILADDVGTDSGSFVFLPLVEESSTALQDAVNQVLRNHNGAALPLPAGHWSAWYEQWDVPDGPDPLPLTFYRNIVLRWDG